MTRPVFTQQVIDLAKLHAIASYPSECCGFVMDGAYHPVANIAEDHQNEFLVSDADYLTYSKATAFMHSHPVAGCYDRQRFPLGDTPNCPSGADMIAQVNTDIVWGITVTDGENAMDPFFWGDFILDEPIYGATFRHGVEDCFTIIRKWYWQERGIKIADYPRDSQWWTTDTNLYMDNLASIGFVQLGQEPRLPGDIGLIKIGLHKVKHLNHAFLYLGDNAVAHHLPGRKSIRETWGARMRETSVWWRYKS